MPTQRLTLWLDIATAATLKELAAQRETKISYLAEEFIRAGLGLVAEERLDGPALPAVRMVVEDALRPHVERLAALIVKAHLEAGIGERLTYVLVARAVGPDKAPQFLDAARTKTIDALKRPVGEPRPME
jgi:hypothetical protein